MNYITAPVTLAFLLTQAWLLGSIIAPKQNHIYKLATGCIGTVLTSITIAVSLHATKTPITRTSLIITYLIIFAGIITTNRLTKTATPAPPTPKQFWFSLILFCILILPYTYFTGIDTYKWQDLAGAIRIEQNIPWLIHPLSLLGFTPRSYPSAQPILLATIQIFGNLSVDAGFAVISLFTAITAACSTFVLGKRLRFSNAESTALATIYIFTPVFTRYCHWATGRGLFLAIYPLLLSTFIPPQNKSTHAQSFRIAGFIITAITLPLCHKVGFVISLTAIPLLLAGLALPKNSNRLLISASIIPAAILALAIAPRCILPGASGHIGGIARFSITRFGILMPLLAVGLLAPGNLFANAPLRRLYPITLLAIPLAFEKQSYGALIAAPLIAVAATNALCLLLKNINKNSPNQLDNKLPLLALAISIPFTIATIIHRSTIATPPRIYKAAMFLEQYDPKGPLTIQAPGRTRTQIQAYLSGCPRFNITSNSNTKLQIEMPPPLSTPPAQTIRAWITYLRGFLSISDASTDWYGKNPRQYIITIDSHPTPPPNATNIYSQTGINIYQTK